MLPWERQVYVSMVAKHVKEQNERIKLRNSEIEAARRRR